MPRLRLIPVTLLFMLLFAAAPRAQAQAPQRVAVMPFKALAGGGHAWIGPGVAETLTSALAAVPEMRVVERAQLRAIQSELKLTAEELAGDEGAVKVGRLLSAGKLVLGSFQIAGGEILINGRFVDTQTGVVIAGKTFQLRGKVERLFDLYPKLVDRVFQTLGVQPQGKAQEAVVATGTPSQSLRAEELYVRGREAFHERTLAGYRQAVELLKQATDEDPAYALGFAALAEAQAELGAKECGLLRWYRKNDSGRPGCHLPHHDLWADELAQRLGYADHGAAQEAAQAADARLQKSCERWPKLALSSATTAVSLAPALPAAHRALSLAYWHSGQRQKAEIEARTLLNLNRSDPWGFYLLGLCSTDAEESRGHHRRSLQLDPGLSQNHLELGTWAFDEGQEDEALTEANQGLRTSPGYVELRLLLSQLLLRAGKVPEALAQAEVVLKGTAGPAAAGAQAGAPAAAGDGHPLARFLRGVGLWLTGGPARPWDRREAWQDAAALEIYRARLHEPRLCPGVGQAHPVDLWSVLLPPALMKGAPWTRMQKAVDELQRHLYDHERDLSYQRGLCAGKATGKVYFLDLKDQRKVVDAWVRGMLMKGAEPAVIDKWWNEFSEWTQAAFEVVACTAQPVTPDDEVKAEVWLDGEKILGFFPVGPDGRDAQKGLSQSERESPFGAPPRTTRPRTELRFHGRLNYRAQRAILQDGSTHKITIKVTRGGGLVAQGQIPFHLVDNSELKD